MTYHDDLPPTACFLNSEASTTEISYQLSSRRYFPSIGNAEYLMKTDKIVEVRTAKYLSRCLETIVHISPRVHMIQ